MAMNRPISRETATVRNAVSGMGGHGLRLASRISMRVLLFLILASNALGVAFMAFSASAYRVKWLPSNPWVAGVLCMLPFFPPIWSILKPGEMSIWIGIFTLLPPMLLGLLLHDAEALSHLALFLAVWYGWAVIQLRSLR